MKPNHQQTGSDRARTTYTKTEQANCPRLGVHCSSALLAVIALVIFNLSTVTVQAEDYLYETNNGTVTVTGYTGPGGDLTIPGTINGLPVTSIGGSAFRDCGSLTTITIPDSVTSIGSGAFWGCTNLTAIAVGVLNTNYCSVDGVLFDKSQTTLLQYPMGKAGGYTVPHSVINIEDLAFYDCASLTSITIPNSVTNIGCNGSGTHAPFVSTRLTAITVEPLNSFYTGVDGVLFDRHQTVLIQYPANKAGASYIIPNSVTTIGGGAFYGCGSLITVTIPSSVISVGYGAFNSCTNLTAAYFQGNLPDYVSSPSTGGAPFYGATNATAYYLPGTTGWEELVRPWGCPTALWLLPYPVSLTTAPNFGIRANQFGFRISWATNASVVVEASTTLANPIWSPVTTNTLINGWNYFSDADWTNYSSRFYRVRSP